MNKFENTMLGINVVICTVCTLVMLVVGVTHLIQPDIQLFNIFLTLLLVGGYAVLNAIAIFKNN